MKAKLIFTKDGVLVVVKGMPFLLKYRELRNKSLTVTMHKPVEGRYV